MAVADGVHRYMNAVAMAVAAAVVAAAVASTHERRGHGCSCGCGGCDGCIDRMASCQHHVVNGTSHAPAPADARISMPCVACARAVVLPSWVCTHA
eukprot:349751-Chlamydomonas_euryale.AAC.2